MSADWHYDAAAPTPAYFALKGFDVVICSYNKPDVGVAEVDDMVRVRAANRTNPELAARLLGAMATNWGGSEKFAAVYRAAKSSNAVAAMPTVENFLRVFARVRELALSPAPVAAPAPPASN